MLFSVLIPVYNAEQFLPCCLASIDRQSFLDYEVVLIDDGSVDGSAAICDEYCKSHNNATVIHKSNQGPFLARRDAFGAAKGQYFICIDSDDELHPDALFECGRAIGHSNADVIQYCISRDPLFSSVDMGLNGLEIGLNDANAFRLAVAGGLSNNLCGKAISRECLDLDFSYKEFSCLRFAEDWFQMLEIANHAKSVFLLNKPLYYYRDNPDSSSSRYRRENYCQLLIVLEQVERYARRWGGRCSFAAGCASVQHLYSQISAAKKFCKNKEDFLNELSIQYSMSQGYSLPETKAFSAKQRMKKHVVDCVLCGKTKLASLLVLLFSK